MSDQQLTLAGPVGTGETIEAAGIWVSVLRLVNTLDDRATLYLKGDTLPSGSPEWETDAVTIPAVVQQVQVPVPANGAIETGVMIVPDPGSSLSVDYGRRTALPPPRNAELPTRAATQYATIRNTGAASTTVSLIYTYQQQTFNPGKGDLLGAELGRVDLGVGEQFRLGGSISGVIDALPRRTILVLDVLGAVPAVLRDASDDLGVDADWSWKLDSGFRIRSGAIEAEWLLGDFGREPRARQVRFDSPTLGQNIITGRGTSDVTSTFTYTFRPTAWVDANPLLDESFDGDPFGDNGSEYRARLRVGSELGPWSSPDSFSTGDQQLRIGEIGRGLDWYYDTSWIPDMGLDLDGPEGDSDSILSWRGKDRGCLWWIIIGTIVFGVAFMGWLLFGRNDDLAVVVSPTASVTEASTTTTIGQPITTTTEVISLLDAFIAWGKPTDAKMEFMANTWGWGQSDSERVADAYQMRGSDIRLFFSNLDEEPGADNAEVKIDSISSIIYFLNQKYRIDNLSNTTFECNTFADGFRTVCASPEAPPEGELAVFIMHLGGPIPVDTLTGESYIYSLVFEADGDPSTDYVAQAPFLGDTFQGTDYWFELVGWEGDGARDWSLEVTDTTSGDGRGQTPSTARAVIWDDMIFWFIPAGEIPNFTGWRFTSFVTDTANPYQAASSAVDAVPGPPDWGLLDPPDLRVSPTGSP